MGGGTSCYYSYGYYGGCGSYPNGSVLTAGAIAGIVIGSLLFRRNNSSSRPSRYPNVYSVPTNMNNRQEPERRSEMYIPPKSSMYSEEPMNNRFYNNV